MFELMLINYMLSNKTVVPIDTEFLLVMGEEYNFIVRHFNQYGEVCDTLTFLTEFSEFDIVDVNESLDYILYKVREAFAYSKMSKLLEGCTEAVKEDSIRAIEQIKSEMESIAKRVTVSKMEKLDIVSNSDIRLDLYKERLDTEGLMGISTGISELDNILHGWMKEDLITIFARTNEGKSWIALFFGVMAWASGKKVLFYSGEMSREVVGYRFDTLFKHFSNTSLMQGRELEEGLVEYENYIRDLRDKTGFFVVTPKDLGDKPTVRVIDKLQEETGADLIIVDQLTLMLDERRGENKRIRYNNISEDLFALSERIQKPIIAVTQARRDTNKKKEEKENTPELDEIYESDGIAQNSTRVISMKVVGRILKLGIKKNRYGEKEKEVFLLWDKDKGLLKPLINAGEDVEEAQDEYGF